MTYGFLYVGIKKFITQFAGEIKTLDALKMLNSGITKYWYLCNYDPNWNFLELKGKWSVLCQVLVYLPIKFVK